MVRLVRPNVGPQFSPCKAFYESAGGRAKNHPFYGRTVHRTQSASSLTESIEVTCGAQIQSAIDNGGRCRDLFAEIISGENS